MEKPLTVRCAEALGWTSKQLPPLGHHPGPTAWRNPETGIEGCYFPPYGEDTPEGWACTGPLMARYGLCTMVNLKVWHCYDAATGNEVGDHQNPCAALADWVAQFVTDGEVRSC